MLAEYGRVFGHDGLLDDGKEVEARSAIQEVRSRAEPDVVHSHRTITSARPLSMTSTGVSTLWPRSW